jgi:hypothetical protein
MNKEYKPVNNSYREHFKLHGYLSPAMVEEILDKVDELKEQSRKLQYDLDKSDSETRYWMNKCYGD